MPKLVHPNVPEAGIEEVFGKQSYLPLYSPRIYENVSSFASPKKVAYDLPTIFRDHTAFMKPSKNRGERIHPAIIAAAAYHATRLTQLDVPMFFVGRDLLTALRQRGLSRSLLGSGFMLC